MNIKIKIKYLIYSRRLDFLLQYLFEKYHFILLLNEKELDIKTDNEIGLNSKEDINLGVKFGIENRKDNI